MTIPFKSERHAISLIGFRGHAGEKNYVIRNVVTGIYMSYMRTLAYLHDAVVMLPYTL